MYFLKHLSHEQESFSYNVKPVL